MRLKNIPTRLSIQRPALRKTPSSGGLKIFGAGMRRRHIKVLRPIRPGAPTGAGRRKGKRRRKGRGFGAIAASVGIPLLVKLIDKI